MSSVTKGRRSLSRSFVLTGVIYGVAILAVAALGAAAVALTGLGGPADGRLPALKERITETVSSVALLSAEPSQSAWDRVRQRHTRLDTAARNAVEGGLVQGTDLDRLVREVLAERYVRLSDAVARYPIDQITAADTSATESALALKALGRATSDYLRTLEQILTEADRAASRAETALGQIMLVLLALIAGVTALGVGVGTVFLVTFGRATLADAAALAAYGARIARGGYPEGKLLMRSDALGEVATALRELTRLEKALYDARDLAANAQGDSRRLSAQAAESATGIAAQAARAESAVRMVDDIVQAMQSVYTNARRSLETAEESGREIERSIQRLLEGADEVAQLGSLTSRIEEIVTLISSIADQTDILSLNAGIEAARAGPYGRGFTVVAGEVRKLADRSGRSALEISELTQTVLSMVQRIAARTDDESLLMSSIQKGLAHITEAVGKVTEVSASARDNIERLSKGIDEITEAVVASRAGVGQIMETVRGLRSDVDRLQGLSGEIGFPVSTTGFASWAVDRGAEAETEPELVPEPETVAPAAEPAGGETLEPRADEAHPGAAAAEPEPAEPESMEPVESVEPAELEPAEEEVATGGADGDEEITELEPVD